MQYFTCKYCKQIPFAQRKKLFFLQEYLYNVMYSANSYRVQEVRIVTKSFKIAPRKAISFG